MSTQELNNLGITPVHIEDEMRDSYLQYAMSVIVQRALPDVRDGLKPVHRRILYAMLKEGWTSTARYVKCAGVVGEVLKKYHPHGDSAVYDAMVRMAQPWSMRHMLIDGQGNFGSPDGHAPAAYRYTESKLTALAEKVLEDIEAETVDFVDNFDGTTKEPTVLPSRVPNLLVNGSEGIAVGMATKIPPHNLGEVVSGVIHLLDNPAATVQDLMQHIPAPDFPTGGFMLGRQGVYEAYTTGYGRCVLRARCEIEDGEKSKPRIIVTELPYQVSGDRLVEKIADLVKNKEIEGISDCNNESGRSGRRIVIDLKRDAVPEVVLNQLYKLTSLQSSFSIQLLCLVGGRPRTLTLREILDYFISHRREVVTRRTQFELRKAKDREHILEGLKIAVDHIDEVIQLIRESQTTPEARARLMLRFTLSEKQSQAILDMRLAKLTGLERDSIERELGEVRAEIERLWGILNDEAQLIAVIRAELVAVRDKFANPRRTVILEQEGEINVEDLIADEQMVVTISSQGYVKRMPLSLFRTQSRGGRGRTGMTTKDDDFVADVLVASALTDLLVFSDHGQVYKLKVYEIPNVGPQARGKPIVNLIRVEKDERICKILPVREYDENHFIVFATKKGRIKRTSLTQFVNINANGKRALNLLEGDAVIDVGLSDGQSQVMLASSAGRAVRFIETGARAQGRAASGVRGMRLKGDDRVIGMAIIHEGQSDGAFVMSVGERGYGKRSAVTEYRLSSRGVGGVMNMRVTDKTGPVVAFAEILDDQDLLVVTDSGLIIRTKAKGVPTIGRGTQGVRLIRVGAEEKVVACTLLTREADDEAEGEEDAAAVPAFTAEELAQAQREAQAVPDEPEDATEAEVADDEDGDDAEE
jgi:DNA gyrase subunit A